MAEHRGFENTQTRLFLSLLSVMPFGTLKEVKSFLKLGAMAILFVSGLRRNLTYGGAPIALRAFRNTLIEFRDNPIVKKVFSFILDYHNKGVFGYQVNDGIGDDQFLAELVAKAMA